MKLTGIEHIESFVADRPLSVPLLCDGLGFQVVGEAGPEASEGRRRSQVPRQGGIRLVMTSALHPEDDAAADVELYKGTRGFGAANIRARHEAVEQELGYH